MEINSTKASERRAERHLADNAIKRGNIAPKRDWLAYYILAIAFNFCHLVF
jgi:hypothetical protein